MGSERSGSVYFGRAVSLQLHLVIAADRHLVLPGSWYWAGSWSAPLRPLATAARPPLRCPLRGISTPNIRRRSWAAASAMIMVGLIVALGTSVASFSASYNQGKSSADARFVVGSDVRVTPSPDQRY